MAVNFEQPTFSRRHIGSVSTPVKRALIEMLKFGALSRRKGRWFSCNGMVFFDSTVLTLLSRQLAIYSINQKLPGAQFVRLDKPGTSLARAIVVERDARRIMDAAAEKLIAEIAKLNEAMA